MQPNSINSERDATNKQDEVCNENVTETVTSNGDPSPNNELIVTEEQSYVCVKHDSPCRIGDSVFHTRTPYCYVTNFDDYTLITTTDFTNFIQYAPTKIIPRLESRWRYVLHVSHGNRLFVDTDLLNARVIGGEIVGYGYRLCSIAGNDCAYYGFIPTENECLRDTHSKQQLKLAPVFPRKLYLYLENSGICRCSEGCLRWTSLTYSKEVAAKSYCGKNIEWDELYITMGDMACDDGGMARDCYVCSQCHACESSAFRCRKHRVCKHRYRVLELGNQADEVKATGIAYQSASGSPAEMRVCMRIRGF